MSRTGTMITGLKELLIRMVVIQTIAGSEQRVKLLLKMTTKTNYCIKQKEQ